MKCIPSDIIPEVKIIEPDVFSDARGYFLETYQDRKYQDFGLPERFVQDNLSFSEKGILRGLHYQIHHAQAKLVSVIEGEIFDVAVDIRNGSPTFGEWVGVLLSSEKHNQLFIPEGFAHGFLVKSTTAYVSYKCSDFYDPSSERGLIWNDPNVGITWGIDNPILSKKDKLYPILDKIANKDLPQY